MTSSRKCILTAATELFARLGLGKTSTRDIAKKSKSNISLISYYFGGKEGLYKEVLKEFALNIQKDVNHIVDLSQKTDMTKETFAEVFFQTVDYMIQLRQGNPEICKIIAREKIEGLPHSREVFDQILYPQDQKFIQFMIRAQKNGIVKKEINPSVLLILLIEGVSGFYEMIECQTSLSKDCEKWNVHQDLFKQQIASIFLNGVLT